MKGKIILFLFAMIGVLGCGNDPVQEVPTPTPKEPSLTIFFINDNHGRIDNFPKVKALVDQAKADGDAILISAGDIFAGNPIVDQFREPGFPMIDIMNQTGFELGVLGNHEFDFGTEVLKDRIDQSQFPWILANVDASNSPLEQPDPYVTLSVGEFKLTFLGLVETNGKNREIPSTHPLRVEDLSFQPHQDVVKNFEDLKLQENSDALIALTHLGSRADRELATDYSFFDLIIGGHSHELINEVVNGTPIVQAGANLQLLGKVELWIEEQDVVDVSVDMIDLNLVSITDSDLAEAIATYNEDPSFSKVVGQSGFNHQSFDVGCFFTTALKEYMEVDFTIQNLGGIRAGINEGPITLFEIYTMDPFNNQSVIFSKTVAEYENFFCETGDRFFFSGINVDESNNDFQIVDNSGVPLPDETVLRMGVNDFIPAVYDEFFDFQEADIKEYTTAQAIVAYLENISPNINFEGCARVLVCD